MAIKGEGVSGKAPCRTALPGAMALINNEKPQARSIPPVYAMNSEGPSRLLNIIFYSYILMFVGNTFYIVGWVYRKWQIHVDSSSRENTEQFIIKGCKSHSILGSILLAGALFVSCRYAPDGKTLTSILAYRDLSTGCAAAYDREVRTRMDIFLDPSISDALVKPIKAKPDVLYYTDLSTAKDKWPNTSVAAFFGKSTVGLDLSDESVD